MTDAAKIALLFDDAELVGQLRAALQERDARIVHEGSLAQFNRGVLEQCGADVLVVNLDDDDENALDRLHEMIDGDRPRLVFNDAQASRGLHGWDRARWARHLAVKALASGDLDPPRPLDAPVFAATAPAEPASIEPAAPSPEPAAAPQDDTRIRQAEAESASLAAELEALMAADDFQFDDAGAHGDAPAADADAGHSLHDDFVAAATPSPPSPAEPELTAAELEALLMADDFQLDDPEASGHTPKPPMGAGLSLQDDDFATAPSPAEPELSAAELEALFDAETFHLENIDEPGHGPKRDADAELPPLYDGHFAEAAVPAPENADAPASKPASFNIDHLSLLPLDAPLAPPAVASDIQLDATPANLTLGPSASWSLVDHDASPPPANAEPAPAPAVEKLSAAEYFAPHTEAHGESPLKPGLSLQLETPEEAIAPQSYHGHEMQLDELGNSALQQVAVLGAAVDSEAAVARFLAALPARLRTPVLLVQHLGGQPIEELLLRLALHSPWPVKLAAPGMRARVGEVLVMPPGLPLRLLRDGRLERQAAAPDEPGEARLPEVSIDATMSAIAQVFGRDVRAIVFAGRSNDALGGAQAIHARGGQVWVEQSAHGHYANMVDAILAERLVDFSGTPEELAARLGAEATMYPTESGR